MKKDKKEIRSKPKKSMIRLPEDFLCLGIESSCDETAASVVKGGRVVLSNIIASQIDIHREFGGVVPEIASRQHVEAVLPVIDKALREASCALEDLDLIAVTYGPGLIGALLVGLSAAKGLAAAGKKPLIGVNHIEGHIMANLINNPELSPPFIALVASGGHSHIFLVDENYSYTVLAATRDDAAGEAFDKIARESGLGYPGGPAVDRIAEGGDVDAFYFPKTRFADGSLDFSFSGVKTAALNHLNKYKMKTGKALSLDSEGPNLRDFAAGFRHAVISVLVEHTFEAARLHKLDTVCVSGGVAANSLLRSMMKTKARESGFKLYIPDFIYCTDNAAMIACAGSYSYAKGNRHALNLNAYASLKDVSFIG